MGACCVRCNYAEDGKQSGWSSQEPDHNLSIPTMTMSVSGSHENFVHESFFQACQITRISLAVETLMFREKAFGCLRSIEALRTIDLMNRQGQTNLEKTNFIIQSTEMALHEELFAIYKHRLRSSFFEEKEHWVFWGMNLNGEVIEIDVKCHRPNNKIGAMNTEIEYTADNVEITAVKPSRYSNLDLTFVDWCSAQSGDQNRMLSSLQTMRNCVIVILNNDFM